LPSLAMSPPPIGYALFPYTTLFRSDVVRLEPLGQLKRFSVLFREDVVRSPESDDVGDLEWAHRGACGDPPDCGVRIGGAHHLSDIESPHLVGEVKSEELLGASGEVLEFAWQQRRGVRGEDRPFRGQLTEALVGVPFE